MKILKSWLNDWINLEDISNDKISEALESLGFEIEIYKELTPDYKNIVVGKVVEIYTHPNADKVRVTKVDVGSNIYEIVCGAWNFEVGAIVPVALPKSYIKENFLIDKRDIRGVISNGMICSATELGLWDDHTGILKLEESIAIGSDFSSTYESYDALWEVGVTPNRGDCMSHLGIARELTNYFNKDLKEPIFKFQPKLNSILKVDSGKLKLCNRYDSVEIENIVIQDSGFNIKYRLSNIGVRVINNVVDYTNYVLHDIGQPLHAFDRDKLFGTISVRLAKPGEKIVTLDSQTRTLEESDLVIIDNDKPVALAGVMGGLETEVTDQTKNLLIESAYFDKVSIMKTSRRLNLISDASIRFERGIDYEIQSEGLKRFLSVFESDQNIEYSDINSHSKNNISTKEVYFEVDEIKNILGISIDSNFILKTLKYLNIDCSIKGSTVYFKPPSWRYDLERPIDLIEELAKHYGFNNFPSTLPIGNNLNSVGNYWNVRKEVIKRLSSNNFHEIQTLSFAEKDDNYHFTPEKESVTLINPIDKTQENLRTNLFSSLISTYLHNVENNNYHAKYFEINNVYDNSENKKFKNVPNQTYSLGIILPSIITNPKIGSEIAHSSIYDLTFEINSLFPESKLQKLEKPGFHKNVSYLITLNGKKIGHLGQLSFKSMENFGIEDNIFLAQIDLEKIHYNDMFKESYTSLSQYPFTKFDLSFKVPVNFESEMLIVKTKDLLKNNENDIYIFDDFINEKNRNIGIRIITRSYDKTYSEIEVNELLVNISEVLENTFNIKLNQKG